VRLEALGNWKNQMTSSGIEPATFQLVASSSFSSYLALQPFMSLGLLDKSLPTIPAL
jgi:hypothetical protein